MMRYAAFQNFLWLWLVPAVAALMVYGVWRRRRAMAAFVGADSVSRHDGDLSLMRIWAKAMCVVVAVGMVVFALTEPQWGTYWSQQRGVRRDIFVALDVSRSMLAEDVTPSRLDRAKADVRDLVTAVEKSGGHRLGLIAFAGAASVKCPLTQVTSHFKLVLDGLGPQSVTQGGTMIGDCIRTAIEYFDDKTQNYRDLILITDGEDMESFPLEAAAAARDAGVTIYAIGFGDTGQGARIPVTEKSGQRSFLEHQGEIVWSKMNEGVLRQIAQITSGTYVPAGTRAIELDVIFRENIEPKTKREMDEMRRERLHHRFQWFLAPAVFLLFIEGLMRDTHRREASNQFATRKNAPRSPDGPPAHAKRGRRNPPSLLPASILLAVLLLSSNSAWAEDAVSLVRQGNRLYEQKKFAEAAELYGKAAELAPESFVLAYNRAAALFQAGDYSEAAKLYEKARNLAPDSVRPQINYALGNSNLQQALSSQVQPDQASQAAKTAVQFYRDAIGNRPASSNRGETNDIPEFAKHNLELAKRLIRELEQQKQQSQQPNQDQQPEKDQKDQPQGQRQQQQSQPTEGEQQPAPDQPDQKPQAQPMDSNENKPQAAQQVANEQLSTNEASERLRAAIARAQMARSRRINDQNQKLKGKRVEKDW